ncbi:MAG: spore coat protein [Ruminococcus sp.]|jgi:spore coat protein CotF|nr:spore coat protein [Ruminococcus sp.]
MNDQELMENMLMLEKGVCDLYLHGTIEASTDNVRSSFGSALNSSLSMQDQIYSKMSEKGWYKTDCAEQDKISQLKQQFS